MKTIERMFYNKWVADVSALIVAYFENFVDETKQMEFEEFLEDINNLYCEE
jgi:hypothetical protein